MCCVRMIEALSNGTVHDDLAVLRREVRVAGGSPPACCEGVVQSAGEPVLMCMTVVDPESTDTGSGDASFVAESRRAYLWSEDSICAERGSVSERTNSAMSCSRETRQRRNRRADKQHLLVAKAARRRTIDRRNALLGSPTASAGRAGASPRDRRGRGRAVRRRSSWRPAPPRQGPPRHPALHERRRRARWTRSTTSRSSSSGTGRSSIPARRQGRGGHFRRPATC